MTIVWTLLVVVMLDGGVTSRSYEMGSEAECAYNAETAREQYGAALPVIAVGTLCVKSEFSDSKKPRV